LATARFFFSSPSSPGLPSPHLPVSAVPAHRLPCDRRQMSRKQPRDGPAANEAMARASPARLPAPPRHPQPPRAAIYYALGVQGSDNRQEGRRQGGLSLRVGECMRMYVCTHTHTHTCMHACIIHIHKYVYIHLHTHTHTRTYVHINTCDHTPICLSVCV
jgi:hypothetical protein